MDVRTSVLRPRRSPYTTSTLPHSQYHPLTSPFALVLPCPSVKVVNETPVPFNLQSIIEPGRPPIDIDAVPANGEVFVPCLLTYAPLLRLRPAGTTGEYNW